MSKFRVNDMAGEFGISSDEVISLLRSMDVPVRNHLSPLSDEQVARATVDATDTAVASRAGRVL